VRLTRFTFVLALAGAACGGTTPAPAATPAPTASRDSTSPFPTLIAKQVLMPVPEDIFVNLGVAAAGYAKGVISTRSIGVYQPTNADARFLRMIQAVTTKWSYRPITAQDFKVVCGKSDRGTQSINGRSCSMYAVNAVLQINYIRMTRDSGFVGGSVTHVPTGATQSERNHYCIVLVRKGTDEWTGVHTERIPDVRQCPRWGP
jgi:hypothetical protein